MDPKWCMHAWKGAGLWWRLVQSRTKLPRYSWVMHGPCILHANTALAMPLASS